MTSSRILNELWRKAVESFEDIVQDSDQSDRLPFKNELLEHKESLKDLIDIYATMQDHAFNPVATPQIDYAHSFPIKPKAQGLPSASSQLRTDSNTAWKSSTIKEQSSSYTHGCLSSELSWTEKGFCGVNTNSAGLNIPTKSPVLKRKSDFTYAHDQQLWQLYRAAAGSYPSNEQFSAVYANMPCSRDTVRNRMSKLIAQHRGVKWEIIPCKAFSVEDDKQILKFYKKERANSVSPSNVVQALAVKYITTVKRMLEVVQRLKPLQGQQSQSGSSSAPHDREDNANGSTVKLGGVERSNSDSGDGNSDDDSDTSRSSASQSRSSYSSYSSSNSSNSMLYIEAQGVNASAHHHRHNRNQSRHSSRRNNFYTPEEDEMILDIYFGVDAGQRAAAFRRLADHLRRSVFSVSNRLKRLQIVMKSNSTHPKVQGPHIVDNAAQSKPKAEPTSVPEAAPELEGRSNSSKKRKRPAFHNTQYTAAEDRLIWDSMTATKRTQCGLPASAVRDLAARLGRTEKGINSRGKLLRALAGPGAGAKTSVRQQRGAASTLLDTAGKRGSRSRRISKSRSSESGSDRSKSDSSDDESSLYWSEDEDSNDGDDDADHSTASDSDCWEFSATEENATKGSTQVDVRCRHSDSAVSVRAQEGEVKEKREKDDSPAPASGREFGCAVPPQKLSNSDAAATGGELLLALGRVSVGSEKHWNINPSTLRIYDKEVTSSFEELSRKAEAESRIPNIAELEGVKVSLTELIAIFQVLDKQVASNNASVVFPAKETNSPAPHQATLSHRLLQHPNTNSNGNGKHGSDDSGSMKSEKKRKFTSQEDSFIWDTYAAFTTNRNLEEDASFSVPDGVVAELAQKLNTNTQKLQARLRELKTERKFQRMMREAQEKAKAQAQQQSKSSKSERRDRDHTNSVNPPMLNTVESAVVSPAPAVDASSNRHSRPQVPHSAPIKPRKTGPYTAEEDATLWADYENNFYQFPDRDQLPRLSTVLQRSTDSLQQRLTQLIADQSGVPVDEVETVEFSPSDDAHIWNTYSKRATAAATITAGLRGGAQNSEDARDALEIQVAEELAPLLGKFYGRIWYRLQWLKEHPIPKKAAPAIPAPFPSPAVRTSSSTPSSSNGGHIFGESTGGVGTTSPQEMMKDSTALAGSKRRRDFESPHSPPSQKTQHSHSARHRLRSATTSTTPPLGSKATVGQKQQLQQDEDDVESGEVSSSGEEVGGGGEGADDDVDKEPDSEEEDADGDSASTYSTRTEGSDSKAKGKNKGNGRGGAGRGTSKPAPSTSTVKSSGRNTNNSRAAGLLPSDGDSDSVGDEDGGDDDDSDRQERQQDRRARKESRDRLLRTGRYCEEEDLEIWLAYTANEGESPVKLGKALSKVARKILRTYNSVAGRLERLLAQQDEAKDQYAPGGSVDDDADADSGDAGGDGAGDGDAEADADGGGDEGTPAAGVAKEEDARSGTATEGEGGDDVGTRRR